MQLTRRNLFRSTGAAAGVIAIGALGDSASSLLSPVSAPPGAWTHDPGSPIGPVHWADIGFPNCGQGTTQSPVNIRTATVAPRGGAPLKLHYSPGEVAVENTGHVVEVPIPLDVHDTLQIGDDRYELTQFHFHAPSEHAVNGRLADLEAHFVHTSSRGATAVVGVFYRLGRHHNELLERILRAAPDEVGEEAPAGEGSPADLFHDVGGLTSKNGGRIRVDSLYAYDGSLTTPGCTEGVRWSVLSEGGEVSPEAVGHLHQVIGAFPNYDGYTNNNRPLQPLNGRIVTHRGARGHG